MIFLGSGRREIRGAVSGLTYVVAPRRRHFRADPRDVDELLKKKNLILQP